MKKNVIAVLLSMVFIFFFEDSLSGTAESTNLSPQMKKKILDSPLKANLRTKGGGELVAYLYATNERIKKDEYYSCVTGNSTTSESRTGDYYIYLYDIGRDSFLPTRTRAFSDVGELTFNIEGADLIVLSGANQNKSDVLLISQFGDCNGNFFEAFGFSKDDKRLQNYLFLTDKKQSEFYGRISLDQDKNNLIAYGAFNDDQMKSLSLSLSSAPSVIQLKILTSGTDDDKNEGADN